MDLQAEQIRLISQVLSVQDAELLLRVRHFLDNLMEQDNYAQSPPATFTEQEFLAKIDASEAALERGEVLTHDQVVAHFRRRAQQP